MGRAVGVAPVGRPGAGRQGDPHKVKGLATASQVRRCFSAATVAAMFWLRPDLERPTAWDLAVRVGTCRGQVCWIPIEDSVAVSAPSRSGKTRWLAYGVVVEFPGAVVTTSVRGELAAGTIMHRKQRGPVAVFAPTGIDAEGEAGAELRRATIRWSLTRGCETPEVALRRAAALAANGGQGTGNDAFWKEHGIRVLAPMLMAAAVSGQGPRPSTGGRTARARPRRPCGSSVSTRRPTGGGRRAGLRAQRGPSDR